MTKKAPADKRADAAPLPAHEDRIFRLAVEAAPNAMVLAGQDGMIVLVNTQAEKLFGYRRDEMVGQPVELLVPERYRAGHRASRAGYMGHPSIRAMGAGRDLFGLRKDGTEVQIEIGLNPFSTEDGSFVLASIIDITDRKRMEKRLAQTEALAAIGGMAAVVAHEIRNPLGSIVMAAKNLAHQKLEPEDLEQVMAVLVGESQRLNRTLEDFLQFARPREPKLVAGDVNLAVRNVLTAIRSDRPLVGGTRLREDLAQGLPPLRFDADQVQQVLWNILRNALQALEGRGEVSVTTRLLPGEAEVLIADTGPGIQPDRLERLFTPFFTTKAQGTGLGLAISRNIMLAHGGDIRVESAPGRGSRFSITLPR